MITDSPTNKAVFLNVVARSASLSTLARLPRPMNFGSLMASRLMR